MGDLISSLYNISFKTFGSIEINLGNIAETVTNIYKVSTMQHAYNMLSGATGGVSGGITALALSVLSLMVLIDFIQMSLRFNKETSWEMILFACVKMAIYIFMINHAREFFKMCFGIGIDMLKIDEISSREVDGMQTAVKEAIKNADYFSSDDHAIMGGLYKTASEALASIIYFLVALPIVGTQIALLSQVLVKFLKYAALAFISPLPIALSYGGGGPAARGFIMQVISSVIDIVLTFFILIMYCKGLGEIVQNADNSSQIIQTAVGLFFYNGLFSGLVSQSTHLSHDMIRG